uniref:capsule assembly Wzi family protein n=2 Tax=Roseivirga sp. TaxID=1964215 RepID=UPI00404738E3
MKKIILLAFTIVLLGHQLIGQTIPLGSPVIQDYLRRQQLLGNMDSSFSFNYRPLVIGKNGLKVDSLVFDADQYFKTIASFAHDKGKIKILPVEFRLAYDTDHPDSRNDGAMIRSRGLQTYVSAGFYTEWGPLTIQLKPEFIFAENNLYQGFPNKPRHFESTWQSRYVFFNRIDEPERYGDGNYTRATFGQSSIRLNQWGLSLGLSTENIWWGPSIRNSLMMSNNAQGFPHITLNTQRPIKTAIGSFEGQIITGRLDASGFDPPAADQIFRGKIQFVPKPDDWRYLQALTFSYSPKWIKGLSLGATRWVQQYSENAKETKSYLPIFQNIFRQNDKEEFGFNLKQDQAASLFGRWVWFDSKAEIYFEFGKNDASINLRDLLVDTDHSRALTFGFNKLFSTTKKDEFYQFNFELTQMSQTESRFFRNALSWYIHGQVRDGYTNNGEVLGSALGPGGNAQYLEVSWVKGLKRIGGAIERYVHNNDFATSAFSGDFSRYWVDYNLHGFVEWQFDKILLRGSLFYTKSLNYQWELEYDPNATPFPYFPGKDRDNFNLDINLAYTF